MNKTNPTNLELTIISGESLSLSARKSPIKKNAYVVIKIGSIHDGQIATTMDTDNGSYPFWNQQFSISMPMHATFLTLEVRCKNFSGDHLVGTTRVPVTDFTGWFFPRNYLHFLSYRLRDKYGGRNGIINLSVKVMLPENAGGIGGSGGYLSSANGWKNGGATVDQGGSHGTVIGVPAFGC